MSSIVQEGHWLAHPVIGACVLGILNGGGAGVRAINTTPGLYTSYAEKLDDEIYDDIMDVLSLCVMLSLQNVKPVKVEPPVKLNRKRESNGELPLYSYHVLEVDGSLWDSESDAVHGEGSGVRSHMRRGHVRRIHNPDRRIWVRATMVTGSRPGFVDKEYHTKGA